MILDGFLSFSTPTAPDVLSLVTGTYNSNNVVDLGLLGLPTSASGGGARDLGIGDDPALKILVEVVTAFTSGGAGTLAINLQGAIDNGSGAPAAFSTWYTSPTYALATLVQGARLLDMDMPRPPDGIAIPRFLRLTYVIGGATMTAGSLVSTIVLDRFDQIYQSTQNATLGGYPAGIYIAN